MSSADRSGELIEDVRGEPDEPKRPAAPRRRGLGRGLGAILSSPGSGDAPEGDDQHPAQHDPLTGLPNRLLLDERLEHALATCQQDDAVLGVLVVALDGFSKVNELFGHRVGDDLLHHVAERMSAARRRSDTVARFAGDEFVVVCPYIGSADLACGMAERILEDVSRPTSVDGVEHHLTASIGVVVTAPGGAPEDTEMLETLLGDAVLAMRHAKDDGGATWRLFDPAMRTDAADRYQYRQDLRAAMENGELVLEYEQIVDLESRTAIGQSARLGWHDSDLDEGPDAVLEVVDEAGLAIPVGRWVLDEALSVLAARRSTTTLPSDFRVWVKVSPSFVADAALVESIDELTAKHHIPPSMIGLDVAEPSVTALPTAEPALRALAARGIALMLDDFGATPSNLVLLQRLPIAGLKLSPEVVAALDDTEDDRPDSNGAPDGAALVRGLVGLGRALGLTVVAQGVVSEFHVATLRSLGCGFAQGPFFGNGPIIESWRAPASETGNVAVGTLETTSKPAERAAEPVPVRAGGVAEPAEPAEHAVEPAPEPLWATGPSVPAASTAVADTPAEPSAPAPPADEPAAPDDPDVESARSPVIAAPDSWGTTHPAASGRPGRRDRPDLDGSDEPRPKDVRRSPFRR